MSLTLEQQVRLVSAKAERPNHPSRGGGSSTPTQTWLHKAACVLMCNFWGGSQQGVGGGSHTHNNNNDNNNADVTP